MARQEQSNTEANCVKCSKRTRNSCWPSICGCPCHPFNRESVFMGRKREYPFGAHIVA